MDVAQVPAGQLVAPAVVLDFSAECAEDPDFLLEIEHVEAWEAEHGPLPDGGWLLYRTGWDARVGRPGGVPQRRRDRPAHARASRSSARAGWPRRPRSSASAWRPSAPTPGAAHCFDPPFPCHSFLLGAGKYGLTQLRNLARLPPTGAVLIAAPLPIVGGSGSPARVLALVER